MGRLQDKVLVVVGAGQTAGETIGNGRAIARTCSREGARVVLVDRDVVSVRETADLCHGPTAIVVADVGDDDGPDDIVKGATESFGGLDVLVNNVGIGHGDAPPHHLTDEAYDRIMDVNLRAMVRTCRRAVPALRARGGGSIINISSLASIAAAGNLTAYKLSKAGVDALTQTLAVTNATHGIRANAVLPGLIDTPMANDAVARALGVDRARVAERRAAQVPLGRQGTAWDVANAVLYLASDEAAFVTGILLRVDGGQGAMVG